MKAALLDIEAIPICATGYLSMPVPNVAAALEHVGEAQDRLLALAEIQEEAEKQPNAAN